MLVVALALAVCPAALAGRVRATQANVDALVATAGGLEGYFHGKDAADRARRELVAMGVAAVPYLIPYLASRAPHEHLLAYGVVLPLGRRAVPSLVPALASADWRTRWGATMVISATRDASVRPHLAALLKDPNPRVRAQAVLGCAFQLDGWGLELLVGQIVRPDPVPTVTLAAVRGIRFVALKRKDLALPAGTTTRLAALCDHAHYGVREAAVNALIEIGPAAFSALEARLDGAPSAPDLHATLALGAIAGENPAVRGAAPVARFQRLLVHPDPRVRAAAAEGLGYWGAEGRTRAAALLGAESNPGVRRKLQQAIGTRPEPRPYGL